MDDDISFGTSVWGAPDDPISPIPASETAFSPAQNSHGFADFDDFAAPVTASSSAEPDDEFGDFGDFGDVQIIDAQGGFDEQVSFEDPSLIPGPSFTDWQPLQLNPLPTREEIQEQVHQILAPLWINDDLSQLTDEDIRQVEGLNQTLVSSERYLFTAFLI